MAIKQLKLKNFTVFEKCEIEFCPGINIMIGENGMGKTHIMKVLYSACQAVKPDVSFPYKLVRVFKPDDYAIRRLVKKGVLDSEITVVSDMASLSMTFSTKTKKYDAEVKNEIKWEKQLEDLTSIFIPAKEILSNAWNLEAAINKGNVDFDDTYLDIISSAKIDVSRGPDNVSKKKYLNILQTITDGKVVVEQEKFYLKSGTQAKIEFNLVAEGIRKIALLWQLIKNGTLEKGSILFWDEPEANINPKYMSVLVEMLLELQQNGVQVFISTHDYVLAKYFDIKRKQNDCVNYYSFYPNEKKTSTVFEMETHFSDLKVNAISDSFDQLLNEVYFNMME